MHGFRALFLIKTNLNQVKSRSAAQKWSTSYLQLLYIDEFGFIIITSKYLL